MANLIATEQYAKNIGGVNTSYTPNLGCTKSRAIALGCTVAGTYSDNQLVCQKDLSKTSTIQYLLRNSSTDYLTNVKIQAGSCIFTGNLPSGGVLYTTVVPSGSSWSITINGSTSSSYIVYPNPNSNVRSYTLNKQTYRYEVHFTQSNKLSTNLVNVFLLSNMDTTLVGTKNYIKRQGSATDDCLIYYPNTVHSNEYIGTFKGNMCHNQGGPITMTNGSKYCILHTIIDAGRSDAEGDPGYITTPWKRLCEFTFYSGTYQYSLNVRV